MLYIFTSMALPQNASLRSCQRTPWSSATIRPRSTMTIREHGPVTTELVSTYLSMYGTPVMMTHRQLTLTCTSDQELFDNDHRVVSQRGSASGRFTFSAAESGDHRICFTPSSNSGRNNWLSAASVNGGIRLTLDLAIGETSEIESADKDKLQDITTRIKDLNNRLSDIRREQVFQRVCATPALVIACFARLWGKKKTKQNKGMTDLLSYYTCRSAKLSSATNLKPPTPALSAGFSSSSQFSGSLARGSFPT